MRTVKTVREELDRGEGVTKENLEFLLKHCDNLMALHLEHDRRTEIINEIQDLHNYLDEEWGAYLPNEERVDELKDRIFLLTREL